MTTLGPKNNAWRSEDGLLDLTRDESPANVLEIPTDTLSLRLNLDRTALIVVDMQRYFCDPAPGQDPSEKTGHQPVVPLASLIPALRAASVPIVWVNWGNRPDEANLPPGVRYAFNRSRLDEPAAFLTKGNAETEIAEGLAAEADDIYVEKYRLSGFWDTPLDSILRNHRIDTVLFAGVNLDQCVYHTLADAHFLGYDCVLLTDCTATTSPAYCTQATLHNVSIMGFSTESTALLNSLQ